MGIIAESNKPFIVINCFLLCFDINIGKFDLIGKCISFDNEFTC